MKIAVTGSNGYIGRHLVPHLGAAGHQTITIGRTELGKPRAKLEGVDAIVHLAAIAHTMGVDAQDYVRVNSELPVDLAIKAKQAGVRLFIFISSSHAETHFDTPYGRSKLVAERELLALSGIDIAIVRPCLVYGANAKGNFGALARLAYLPILLPLEAAENRRSMIYVGNLVNAIEWLCVKHGVGGRIFTATDPGLALAIADIVSLIRNGMGRSAGLFRMPLLPRLLRLCGAGDLSIKLFSEQIVDGSALFDEGWSAPYEPEDALRAIGQAMAQAPLGRWR